MGGHRERSFAAAGGGAIRCVRDDDRNLSFQQNVKKFSIFVAVLRAKTNRLADLRPLVPMLLTALKSAEPGTVSFIDQQPTTE
jgi:hypothetical protein